LTDSETAWVRSHWALAGRLRAVLRTEPNVALAVLFGSMARGDDVHEGSDVDLLVALRTPSPDALHLLYRRLSERLEMDLQLVPLDTARRDPRLMSEVLRDGRPLVDRRGMWFQLQAQRGQTLQEAAAAGDELREEARAALGYFQRLAAERSPIPAGVPASDP
jgi:predicted nucleotidyltransferase